MAVEGFGKLVKLLMLIANLIIFIGGSVVFAIGVYTISDKSFMERLLGTDLYLISASLLIATGSVVAVISFIGTLGAYKEIKCMLVTFFVILAMIFFVMLTGGILGYIFRNEVDDKMHSEMLNTITSYGEDPKVTLAWDSVQQNVSRQPVRRINRTLDNANNSTNYLVLPIFQFNCCGVTATGMTIDVREDRNLSRNLAFASWALNSRFRPASTGQHGGTIESVPLSCCKPKANENRDITIRSCQRTNLDAIYRDDCYIKMKDFVKQHALLVGGIGIGISFLLLLGMLLSCSLCFMIKNGESDKLNDY